MYIQTQLSSQLSVSCCCCWQTWLAWCYRGHPVQTVMGADTLYLPLCMKKHTQPYDRKALVSGWPTSLAGKSEALAGEWGGVRLKMKSSLDKGWRCTLTERQRLQICDMRLVGTVSCTLLYMHLPIIKPSTFGPFPWQNTWAVLIWSGQRNLTGP